MEDQVRRTQQAFSAFFQGMMDQWLQEVMGDEVMRQYWSATNIGSRGKQPTAIAPYRVLGLQKNDSDEQVKKRYRELAVKLHPDTAGMKGTEFLLQIVMAAYQQISRERGWRK